MRYELEEILLSSEGLGKVLRAIADIGRPALFVAAGSVAQTVWNRLEGREPGYGIKDIDVVYYDRTGLQAEEGLRAELRERLGWGEGEPELDLVNEARVHEWYERERGLPMEPYGSLEEAVSTFPTTATAIACRLEGGRLDCVAPFGLTDLMQGIVRPNKKQITREVYENKVERWRKLWPGLRYEDW